MKYCTKCGHELVDEAIICTNCGCAVTPAKGADPADAPNMGFAVLSFFIPLVGLILYLIFKDRFPQKAKSCGKGAIIGFVTGIVLSVIYAVVLGSLLGSLLSSFDSYDYYY